MACRRETRRFLTASPRAEGQARLTGRGKCKRGSRVHSRGCLGVLGGEQGQTSGRGCQSTAMTWGASGLFHTCLPFSPGPLSPCCPLLTFIFLVMEVIHSFIHYKYLLKLHQM